MKINPSEFALRLHEACDHYGLPAKNKGRIERLAELIGVSKMTVSYWFDAKFLPAKKKREKICSILGISQSYLEYGEGDIKNISVNRPLTPYTYKLITRNNYNKSHDFKDYPEISMQMDTHYPLAFAAIIDDNSMYPIYPKNTLALINPSNTIKNNSIVAAFNEKENLLFFRQYIDAGNRKFLSPMDDDYQTFLLSKNISVVGIIVYVQMSSFL